ncbi:DUF6115 domain-containing protein [Ornithinibacillus xuwenensis]|uniref:Swarming motility protein SwrB n=1 Tax=Ornithinibacillus xuwenensis TaxID=3144668 RepID=A0ABU9XDT9_9BACI
MTSFLFIISFLLHIVSLVAIYVMYKQLTISKGSDTAELVNLMESYLEEIKEENRLLQQEVNQVRERKPSDQSLKNTNHSITPTVEEDEQEEFLVPIDEYAQDEIEVSLQSRIFKLHEEGLSVDEIAKTLNCGKTEVELIIKFSEKK